LDTSRLIATLLLVVPLVALTAAPSGAQAPDDAGAPVPPVTTALEGVVDPDSYVLGAGDGLGIGFWGDVNRFEIVYVNPDGEALVKPVGPIRVDGLSLAEAGELIREKLSPYYTPAILSVSLASLRTFKVHVVGMVNRPGAYEANAVTRVSQAIGLAGGLMDDASLRHIELRRPVGNLRTDLARYFFLGDNGANPYLNGGDVVYVPPRSVMVNIHGRVYREGAYEFVEGETVADLVDLAGGFRPEALTDSLEIERFCGADPTEWTRFFVDGGLPSLRSLRLEMDDHVFVRNIPGWHEDAHVVINGEVRHPGRYVIRERVELLSEVVERAGGFTEQASLAEAVLIRGMYAGRDLPPELELRALVSSNEAMDWKEKDLYKVLKREPKGIVSFSLADMYAREPGEKPFDPALRDGDIIEIPTATDVVRVMGHAGRPGLVPLEEGREASYYIKQAGGYASRADRRGTRVIRARTGQKLKAGGTPVHAGDIIWIPEKKERDGWETFRDVATVLAQLAAVFLVIDAATE
jgi:protein involved in polysaccharide export with SLBB domain